MIVEERHEFFPKRVGSMPIQEPLYENRVTSPTQGPVEEIQPIEKWALLLSECKDQMY
jgi:hypothetical protein